MTARLELFLFGPARDSEPPAPQAEGVVLRAAARQDAADSKTAAAARGDRPLVAATGEELDAALPETEAELIAFADRLPDIPPAALSAVVEAFRDEAVQAGLLPFARTGSIPVTWTHYPNRLAVLVEPPEENNLVVFRRSALQAAHGFADGKSPLWRWLLEAVSAGRPIAVVPSAPLSVESSPASHPELPPLVPDSSSPRREWLLPHLSQSSPKQLIPDAGSGDDAVAVQAGLYQLHGFLEESHRLSQSVQGRGRHGAGDYWHAIMHRREPDYSNSKYWFRRVGRHPVFLPLAAAAAGILSQCTSPHSAQWKERLAAPDDWDPFAFVDMCRECASGSDPELIRAAEQIQHAEMLLLLGQSYADATA